MGPLLMSRSPGTVSARASLFLGDAYTRGRGRQLWLSVKGCLISREKGRLVAGNALYSGQRAPTKFPDFFVTCRALCLRFHCSARVTLAR